MEFHRALNGAARVAAIGAAKYGRGNWQKGMPDSEVIDSAMRHLLAVMAGEDIDPDSGLPHVDAFVCNALMLAEYRHKREWGKQLAE